jgi:hypothetical protein
MIDSMLAFAFLVLHNMNQYLLSLFGATELEHEDLLMENNTDPVSANNTGAVATLDMISEASFDHVYQNAQTTGLIVSDEATFLSNREVQTLAEAKVFMFYA